MAKNKKGDTSSLQKLSCPRCGFNMDIRKQIGSHANDATRQVKIQTYYQYFCEVCDDEESGWTTPESDKLSIKLNK